MQKAGWKIDQNDEGSWVELTKLLPMKVMNIWIQNLSEVPQFSTVSLFFLFS